MLGNNDSGQLGNNLIGGPGTPFVATGLSGISKVSVGPSQTCALNPQNEAFCWGRNSFGQLGLGLREVGRNKVSPTRVGTTKIKEIFSGAGKPGTFPAAGDQTIFMTVDDKLLVSGKHASITTGMTGPTMVPK